MIEDTSKISPEEKALQEEDRLERMMNRYFTNMNKENPVPDTIGVEQPLINQTPVVETSPKETNAIEVEEEEVFIIQPDGDITSEAEEKKPVDIELVYKQPLVDRVIYNLAISAVYNKIQDYRDMLIMVHDDMDREYNVRSMTQNIRASEREVITGWLKELSETQFSLFKSVPSDDVLIEKIKSDDLRKIVDIEVEKQIKKRLGILSE